MQQRIREEKPRPRRRDDDEDRDRLLTEPVVPRRSTRALKRLSKLRAESDAIARLVEA
jgi:hypothetical protein